MTKRIITYSAFILCANLLCSSSLVAQTAGEMTLEERVVKLEQENEMLRKMISSNQLAYAVDHDEVENLKEQVALIQNVLNGSVHMGKENKQASNELAHAYNRDVVEELQDQVALMQNLLNQLMESNNETKKD